MRAISADGLRQLLAEDMSSFWVFAIILSGNPLDPDYDPAQKTYLTANTEDLTFEGQVYTAFPMEVTLASDQEDTVPQARLKIDNLSREMAYVVRRTNWPPTIELMVFRVSGDKTTITKELGPSKFVLLSATLTEATMEGILGYENDFLNMSATQGRFTPVTCPGLF